MSELMISSHLLRALAEKVHITIVGPGLGHSFQRHFGVLFPGKASHDDVIASRGACHINCHTISDSWPQISPFANPASFQRRGEIFRKIIQVRTLPLST